MVSGDTAAVRIDSRENHQNLDAFAAAYMPALRAKLEHYTGERPLFDLYNVEPEIEKALARRVDLKSGGTLVIDQTEAMTTIDVNTGGFVGQRNFDDTVFKTNLEAAQAIARQLRLRNLGGIIVVDFIDMDSEEHRAAVLAEFKRALERDRTRMTVSGFTALGLVEMTRKRTRESLAHVLCEPCAACGGRGEVKTARTVCYEVLREVLREARAFNAREYRVLASQPVCDLFQEEESGALAMLSDFIGKPVSIQVETSYIAGAIRYCSAMTDICFTPAKKLARLIRSRKLSATEVMKAFIAQIERVNPKVNAIVTFLPEAALSAAKKFDRNFKSNKDQTPGRPADRLQGPGGDQGHPHHARLAGLHGQRADGGSR